MGIQTNRAITRQQYHAARRSYRSGQRFAAMSDSYTMRRSDERAARSRLVGLPAELVRIITRCPSVSASSWIGRRCHMRRLLAWRHSPSGASAWTEQQIARAVADARLAYCGGDV